MKDWILDHELGSFCGFAGLLTIFVMMVAAIIHSSELAVAAWVIGATLILGSPFWIFLIILIASLGIDAFHLEDRQLPPHSFSANCPCIRCKQMSVKPYTVYCRRGRSYGDFYGEV